MDLTNKSSKEDIKKNTVLPQNCIFPTGIQAVLQTMKSDSVFQSILGRQYYLIGDHEHTATAYW